MTSLVSANRRKRGHHPGRAPGDLAAIGHLLVFDIEQMPFYGAWSARSSPP